jgi:hypothetical protein
MEGLIFEGLFMGFELLSLGWTVWIFCYDYARCMSVIVIDIFIKFCEVSVFESL